MKLDDHPTVKRYRSAGRRARAETLDAGELRALCLEAGADDAGFVTIDDAALADQREGLLRLFPRAKTVIAIVGRLNPDNIRCVARSAADLEFLNGAKRVDAAAQRVQVRLRDRGVRSLVPSAGFPMDQELWPERMWPISHKPVAVAAGLGKLGHHRLFVHPRFGAFVFLGSILIDAEVSEVGKPLDFDPCVECKLCVAACPVGAIGADGHFAFATCLTHNYRDRQGGFSDWVENIVSSGSVEDYRRRVSDPETVSMWQSLAYGICNKSSYCMAVCPAGEEVIGPFIESRKRFLKEVVRPLQANTETVYVLRDSDGEDHVRRRFPHKKVKVVGNGLRPATVGGFLDALPLVFNRGKSEGLDLTYHFSFHGDETIDATVVIRDRTVTVERGHVGQPDLRIIADSATWLRFLAGEAHPLWSAIRGKIKIKGPLRWIKSFAACFPS